MKRFCLYCKKELSGRRRKFCCANHMQLYYYHNNEKCNKRIREYAKLSYYKNKDKEEYKKMKKKYFDKWRKKNRDRFNALMRVASRKYKRKLYRYRLDNNLCVICGGKRDSKFKSCSKCRRKIK